MVSLRTKLLRLRQRIKGEWNESDHPRDEAGRFGQGGGGTKPADRQQLLPAGKNGNKALPDHSRPKLTGDEQEAIELYSHQDYGAINAALRAGKEPERSDLAGTLKGLRGAMDKAVAFPEPVLTFRGMKLAKDQLEEFVALVEQARDTGGTIAIAGYQSTSTKGVLEGFAGNVELRIMATHGLDARPYSVNQYEDELILNHHSSFRIERIERSGGRVVVGMVQVSHGKS